MTDRHVRHRLRAGVRSVLGPWRLGAAVAFVAAGTLFVTSSIDSRGGDLRSNSVTDLGTLVQGQRSDTDAALRRVADLNREVNALSAGVGGKQVQTLRARADALRGPAGTDAVAGPGVVVTLRDAPDEVADKALAAGHPPQNTFVVHQQDIQAVVNALWLGGARGITVMNQRVVSTTGIKCAGSTVILHGVPFAPPYVIRAVGDPGALLTALDDSDYISAYRVLVARYSLGYDVATADRLELPGYDGTLDLRYAEPTTGG